MLFWSNLLLPQSSFLLRFMELLHQDKHFCFWHELSLCYLPGLFSKFWAQIILLPQPSEWVVQTLLHPLSLHQILVCPPWFTWKTTAEDIALWKPLKCPLPTIFHVCGGKWEQCLPYFLLPLVLDHYFLTFLSDWNPFSWGYCHEILSSSCLWHYLTFCSLYFSYWRYSGLLRTPNSVNIFHSNSNEVDNSSANMSFSSILLSYPNLVPWMMSL